MPPDDLDADLIWLLDEFAALDGQVEAEFGPSADSAAGVRRAAAIIERVRSLRGVVQAAREVAVEMHSVAETWLYDGDTDQPTDEGYYRLIYLADALAAAADAPQPAREQR